MAHRYARYLNIILGLWLVVSAFAWPHAPGQFTNAWMMGVIAAGSAAIALSVPGFRLVNTFVGIWLVISVYALPRFSGATALNNVVVGLLIAIASLAGPGRTVRLGDELRSPA